MTYKILLVRPNISVRKGYQRQNKMYPPLGLAYLATPLLRKGYEVKIVDMVAENPYKAWEYDERFMMYGIDDADLEAIIRDFKPDLLGISCIIPQNPRMIDICEMVHEKFPGLPIALGGAHPSVMPEYCLEKTGADYVLKSDSEHSFTMLVDYLATGQKDQIPSIPGLVMPNDDGTFLNNMKSKPLQTLDHIQFPAWHLLPNASYQENGISMPVITSRGCPYDCTFCCANLIRNRKWTMRTPGNVVDEIEILVNDFGYKNITIFDDAFNIRAERAIAICEEIVRRNIKVHIIIPSSLVISLLTRDVIRALAKAGCVALALPFEHIDEKIRNTVIKKRLSSDHFEKVMSWCREEDILTVVNFVIGMPGESEESLQKVIDYVRGNAWKMDALSVYIATPFPGTQFYAELTQKDFLKNADRNRYIEYDLYECVIETPWASSTMINEYKDKINEEFAIARGGIFDDDKIRQAIRRPNEEVVQWLKEEYFPKRKEIIAAAYPETTIVTDQNLDLTNEEVCGDCGPSCSKDSTSVIGKPALDPKMTNPPRRSLAIVDQ